MAAPYTVLAPVYQPGGFAQYATNVTPLFFRLLLERADWMGRNILDLGCGTGVSMLWMKQQGYGLFGLDSSPNMLNVARQSFAAKNETGQFYEQDMRQLAFEEMFDLVFALNSLNELDSLRELEATFRGVHRALNPNKLFAFDLITLEGLARASNTERIFHDSPDSLTIFTRSEYDYDRQLRTNRYWVFTRQPSAGGGGGGSNQWQRTQTDQTLRGYSIPAVITLLQRCGFEVPLVLAPNFAPLEAGSLQGIERVFVVARKTSG
jgi:SAM-dependent methyltransferase